MKKNNEEDEKLSEGEKLYNLTQSDEWSIFKDRYEDVMLALADIRNIPFEVENKEGVLFPLPAEQRTYEMQVRERTLLYLQEIMSGLTADVDEYTELIKDLKIEKRKDDSVVIRFN